MNSPIFVVGANRSGTTLLRLILNAHSEIAIPDELAFFRGPHFFTGPTNWRNQPLTSASYSYFVRSFLERNKEELRPLDCSKLYDQILALGGQDVKVPYQFVLEAWAATHGKRRWGEKTPGNLFYARDILEMFPDALFVYMVRDPRGGVSSMKRASIFSTDVVINALNRHKYMSAGLRILEEAVPSSARTIVRFEDLLSDPEEVVRGLCAFLGVSYEAQMLSYHDSASHFMNRHSATDINVAATGPISKEKAETWRQRLTKRELAMIETVCRADMERHGYEVENLPISLFDRLTVVLKSAYWMYQMHKHRNVPVYQVMHGVFPRFRRSARPGGSK